MDWEMAFQFSWLFAQLCAICAIGAFVADHIVQPVLDRRRKRKPACTDAPKVSEAAPRQGIRP